MTENWQRSLAGELPRHIHLIGIGGSGLSAIARLLLESGVQVSGSDRSLSALALELAADGARVMEGHRAENIAGAQLVVRSSAIPDENVEVQAALAAGIPVLKRAQFLGRLMEGRLGIAVAGTHGKTTTTAMIAWILVRLGLDPSYIVGGTVKNLGGRNAHAGAGPAFVIEADEYDRMFLGLTPDISVVSYLEHDHPDCYPTPEVYLQAFIEFVRRVRPGGTLLVSYDNPAARSLAEFAPEGVQALRYGVDPEADYIAVNLVANARGGFDYDAYWQPPEGQPVQLGHISLQVAGDHNVRNSLAALAVIHQVAGRGQTSGDWFPAAARALGEFEGTGRRFDVQGQVNGITIIDDYAHHPTEIRATLAAARARYPEKRIWAVWQPHTFSRTQGLLDEFARSFKNADRVIVTEVYAAREKAQDFGNFSAAQVAAIIQPQDKVQFIAGLKETTEALLRQLQPGDVLLVLSAGDADHVSAQVLAALKERIAQHD